MRMKLSGAIIGYGFISSHGHLPSYLERSQKIGDVEIIAIADICEARRILAKQALPKARIYASHEELLRHEADHLDFVDISTPPSDHAKIVRTALDANLHVLCEKPLTTNLEDARDLLARAKTAERVLFPAHNYKHAPVVKAIRAVIESGQIGKVTGLTLSTFRNTHAKGVSEWNTHWRRSQIYGGGGIAMDHGSHSFYLMFDWMNNYPTSITAKMSNQNPEVHDTEDNFSATISFPNGLAHCHLTWTAGVRKVIYTVQGTRGAITVDDDEMQISVQEKNTWPGYCSRSSHMEDREKKYFFELDGCQSCELVQCIV